MKKLVVLLLVAVSLFGQFAFANGKQEAKPAAATAKPVTITLWTKEGEADGALQFVQALADSYTAKNPNVTFEVVNKNVEELRQDFQTASLAGSAPDLLWTVSDHAGPFVTADLIQPVEKLFDMSKYVESVVMNGKTWAVPITSGNHLMLYYNKKLLAAAPTNTDDMIKVAKSLTKGEQFGLVYNLNEAFWMAPWLGGFKGKVFAADGVTPTLNTPEMIATLDFLASLKLTQKIVPNECDYNGADTLFKEGKAAMIINGDWTLAGYKEALGADLGIARIPMVSATKEWPKPYTSGVYFMIPRDLAGDKLAAVKDFITFATSVETETALVEKLGRLPGIKTGVTISDPLLKASADQMVTGTPMPTVLEMRAIWDAILPELAAVMSGAKTGKEAAAAMQSAAVNGIKALK